VVYILAVTKHRGDSARSTCSKLSDHSPCIIFGSKHAAAPEDWSVRFTFALERPGLYFFGGQSPSGLVYDQLCHQVSRFV
jgi:hypothetical protein